MTTAVLAPTAKKARRPKVTPVSVGPSWARTRSGWLQPKYTLGWEVLKWAARWLQQPDGPDAGKPWMFTPEQSRFVLHWYAIDETGRFTYRSGVYRRMKGTGKTPMAAALCAVEFVGPCRFGGWGKGRQPIAIPHPAAWVQTVAVSRDQTRNMMTLFPGLFTKDALAEFGIDLGKEIIYAHQGRCRIEAVTSSPRSLEGGRSTFVVKDENHHWLSNNDGHAMSEVIARNLAKSRDGSARALATTNAFDPNEDSDAARDWEAYQAILTGRTRASGFLYDSLEAPADTVLSDPDSLRAGLEAARGDSHWLDIDRLMAEIYDPRTLPSLSRRFYLNQVVAAEDAWVSPQEWDALADKTHEVPPKAQVTLGLDGSLTGDHTALIACEVETEHLFTLGIWDPERYTDKEIPRRVVDAAVEHAFATYDVVGFLSDVHLWETYIEKWEEEHGETLCVRATDRKPIAYDMRGHREETVRSIEAFHDAIVEGALSHDGHPLFRQHVHNARNRPWTSGTKVGMEFGKESPTSGRKIDAAAAAMLARKAMQAYKALPEGKRRGKSNDWFVV